MATYSRSIWRARVVPYAASTWMPFTYELVLSRSRFTWRRLGVPRSGRDVAIQSGLGRRHVGGRKGCSGHADCAGTGLLAAETGFSFGMRKYWEVYRILLRNSLIREMSFKGNFLLWMITELLWFLGQIVFVDVLFAFTDRLGDWTKWEVVLLIGTHQIISQIFQAFCYVNISNLPELVRTGRLDLMLLLPVDTQFAVSTRQFGLDNVVNAGIALAFVDLFRSEKLGVVPSPWQVGFYVLGRAPGQRRCTMRSCFLWRRAASGSSARRA